MSDDGLENAAVVVGMMTMLWRKYDVTRLIAYEIFVVWGYQQELALLETSCAAIVCQVELPAFPFLHVDRVAKEFDASFAVADVQA